MRQILFILTALSILITACAPTGQSPSNSNTPSSGSTPNPPATEAVPSPSPMPIPSQAGDIVPRPEDSALVRGQAFLDSVELITMESNPLQFALALKGNLPTPCHQLRVAVSPPDAQNKIAVDVYSVVDPNAICVQVIEPFDTNYQLGSYPAGHYTLWVNGEQVAEFDA